MKNLILIGGLMMLFCFAAAGEALACTCVRPKPGTLRSQVTTAYQDSRAVFTGEVLEVTRNETAARNEVKIRIEKSWKNKLAKEITIYTGLDSAGCGFPFEVGKKYLIYADFDDEEKSFNTNLCQRTKLFVGAGKELTALNRIKRPSFPK